MEKSEFGREIRKRAWGKYTSHLGESLAISFAFFLVTAGVCAIAAFDFILFLVALMLIEFPLVYCLHQYCASIFLDQGLQGGTFFRRFGSYFTHNPGVYRAFATIARMLLIYFLAYAILGMVLISTHQGDPGMAAELEQVASLTTSGSPEALYNFFAESTAVVPLLRFSSGLAGGVSAFFAVHTLGYFGPKTYLFRGSPAGGGRSLGAIYAFAARKNWSYFHKLYYSLFWHGTVLFVVGFGLGFGIANHYLYGTLFPIGIGLAAASLLLAFYFPYFSYASALLFRVEEREFAMASLRFARMQIENLHLSRSMSEEEFKQMQEKLQKAEEENEKLFEQHKNDPFLENEEKDEEDKEK